MASTNHETPATPPTTPPAGLSKSQILTDVLSLATQFSTCVEAFNLVHPYSDTNRDQKIALAKLGIQQGRLLIFGDAVGISSPPPTIARHMIPSHPGITNPDPNLPVNFGIRDPRLDEDGISAKIRAALNEIAGRPAYLTREELMEKYGLKAPKRFSALTYPALDTNRLEAFREKYSLLQDLVKESGIRGGARRTGSMTINHWIVRDVDRFEEFVKTVRLEVDGLVALLGVKEQVDRGMRTDIKAFAWHPDLSGPVVRQDWEKLRLIREAVEDDYPEYKEVAEQALKYISEELKGTHIAGLKAAYPPPPIRRKSSGPKSSPKVSESPVKTPDKTKRPNLFAGFSFKWGKSKKSRDRSKSIASTTSDTNEDPQRSLSEDIRKLSIEENGLEPVRSKSLSAVPDAPAPFNLDTRLQNVPTNEDLKDPADILVNVPTGSTADESWAPNPLALADTAHSLVDRHDMYKGVGRIDTKDIRDRSHEAAGA